MRCFEGRFSPEAGHIVVAVGFFNPLSHAPANSAVYCDALVDTGATCTCIDPAVADEIGAPPDGEEDIAGAHGIRKLKTHTVSLMFPDIGLGREAVAVVGLPLGPSCGFRAILGMDILAEGTFSFDAAKTFTLCI